ncbi:MAG: hypothetical protein H0T15_00390, partial [Thermoleophilaceae bacterium]|nr:hypothetical protein [Thermoleophilaceae bacterium]
MKSLRALTLALALVAAAPVLAQGPPSGCGQELHEGSPQPGNANIVCGTYEGDNVSFAGQAGG